VDEPGQVESTGGIEQRGFLLRPCVEVYDLPGSWLSWRWVCDVKVQITPFVLPNSLETTTQSIAAKGNDGVGAPDGPEHA